MVHSQILGTHRVNFNSADNCYSHSMCKVLGTESRTPVSSHMAEGEHPQLRLIWAESQKGFYPKDGFGGVIQAMVSGLWKLF